MSLRTSKARRPRWRIISIIIGAVFWVAVLCALACATCRPAWYVPMTIDQERLKEDKREFVNMLDAIGGALNRGQTFNLELNEEQVNRWLAARAELPEDWSFEVEGATFPQISFLAGNRVRIAATVSRAGVEVVLSATVRLDLSDEHLLIHIESVRAGSLPVPHKAAMKALAESLEIDPADADRHGSNTILTRNVWEWPNGRRRFRILTLEVDSNLTRVSLEPFGGVP
ncbi:MAG: hypothetical protein ABIG44_15340 [Planctomycetota bacterium]